MTTITYANKQDKKEILALYRSMIGTDGCTWTMDYPNEQHIDMDIESENLFLIRDDHNEIIATLSIDQDKEVDALPNWTIPGKSAELARIAVRKDYQGQGIARELITTILEFLPSRGYKSAHYLVSETNNKAIASYKKLNFKSCGTSDLYGEHWLCFEKEL